MPAAPEGLPVRDSRKSGLPGKSGSRDECLCLSAVSLAGLRPIQLVLDERSILSAAPEQWLWQCSETSFPHRIRKSGQRDCSRRTGLPLDRRWAPTADPSAYPEALPPEN